MTMLPKDDILLFAKPSLRKAYFYGFIYAGAVVYGRFKTDLDPRFNTIWLGLFGVLVVLMFIAFLKRWTTTYIVTSTEVQSHSGILARQTSVVPLHRVTNARAQQSLLERILGLVSIHLDTAGGEGPEVSFFRILKIEGNEVARIIRNQANTTQQRPQKLDAVVHGN